MKLRADGGMDVTWKLRPGVKWHDGKPHTSADVKFTVDAINKGDWKPESTDGFDRISSVDTPDSLTAVVHYKEVYAPYQMQFFRGTLPKHVLDWILKNYRPAEPAVLWLLREAKSGDG